MFGPEFTRARENVAPVKTKKGWRAADAAGLPLSRFVDPSAKIKKRPPEIPFLDCM